MLSFGTAMGVHRPALEKTGDKMERKMRFASGLIRL